MGRAPHALVHVLFFVSGMSGLVYEVVWVRSFGNVFGNTVRSASLVTALFMGGLGLGAWAAGGWADRQAARSSARLLRAYGAAELGAAAFALGIAHLLPRLGGLSARFSSYAAGANGWFEPSAASRALAYATATALMLPPTLLMGATLTLLVRWVMARQVHDAGWRVGVLYGVNTAGAAAGAAATDLLLVPALGLLATQRVAAAAQAAVALAAFALAARAGAAPAEQAREPEPGERASRLTIAAACGALALTGFSALGMEIVWFRALSAAVGAYRPVFSLVLTTILVGILAGSVAGGAAHRRFGRALELLALTQALLAASSLALLASFSRSASTPRAQVLGSIAYVVAFPSLLMGFSMPLASAIAHDALGRVGRRMGALYVSNTLAGVAGALVAGFVLAPRLGSQQSFGVFAACAALAPAPLAAALRPWPRSVRRSLALGAALSLPMLAGWFALPPSYLLDRFFPPLSLDSTVIAAREGVNEVVTVVEDGARVRRLYVNGHRMSGCSIQGQRYMRAFSHLPLLMMERPERALVICFGVGSTLHAASLHRSLARLEIADLSRNVLEHAGYFEATNRDVLRDGRVAVFVDDGRQHLRAEPPESYDLITLEPPPIPRAGVSSLYSRELYELARSRLKPGGLMTQWFPAYQVPAETALSVVRAFLDVFPGSVMLSGQGSNFILLGARRPPVTFDLDRVERALALEPEVARDLERVRMGTLTELVGTFVADAGALRRATAGAPPVTDDRPLLEYTFWRRSDLPASLFALGGVAGFCPACFADGRLDARVGWLDDYQRALGQLYASRAFATHTRPGPEVSRGVEGIVARSEYLRDVFSVSAIVTEGGDRP
jgi:spermidine synthase